MESFIARAGVARLKYYVTLLPDEKSAHCVQGSCLGSATYSLSDISETIGYFELRFFIFKAGSVVVAAEV